MTTPLNSVQQKMPHPWMWESLGALPPIFLREQPLPLLFVEPGGLGLEKAWPLLLQAKYCSHENRPCGQCESCVQISKGVFPLTQCIAAVDGKITVDAVRELAVWLSQKSAKACTVLMPGADRMTLQAANAFLKVLEEPLQNTTFLLTTSMPESLLPTIKSRLLSFKAVHPDSMLTQEYLSSKGYDSQAIALALQLTDGQVFHAQTFLEQDFALHQGLQTWLQSGSVSDAKWITQAADKSNLAKILDWWIRHMRQTPLTEQHMQYWSFLDKLVEHYALVHNGTVLNGKLLLTALHIEWVRLKKAR